MEIYTTVIFRYYLFFGCKTTNIFSYCIKLDADFSKWNLDSASQISNMFAGCKNFTGKGLENWNTKKITNTASMFTKCDKFTGKSIENWDVSNIRNMDYMFSECPEFDCDLSNWDVSNITHMHGVFFNCEKFKGQNLENWNVKKTKPKDMVGIFDGCKLLKNKPSWYKYAKIRGPRDMYNDEK